MNESSSLTLYHKSMRKAAYMWILVCAITLLVLKVDLYFIFPWFDNLMHALGGIAVGYTVLAFSFRYETQLGWLRKWYGWLLAIGLVVLGWEVFEYTLKLINIRSWEGLTDSFTDICAGYVGSLVAYYTMFDSKNLK